MPSKFILASGSPRRRELIGALSIDFDVIKPDIDETQHRDEAPYDYVQRLSREKAQAVIDTLESPVTVLAADTIVVLSADTIGVTEDNRILGKPADADEARVMLRSLRDRPHVVATAMTLVKHDIDNKSHAITRIEKTRVHMRPYSDDEIEAYIASGDPFDKAGSYAIQNPDFVPVARLEGCYYNVVGLPMCVVLRGLREVGWTDYDSQPTQLTDCDYADCPFKA